jgi:dolichol-phosphate mannosyltransferase
VVVPIRNEGANVWPLVFGLRTALGTQSAEVLFVDDSDDDTPQVVQGVAELMSEGRSDFRVRLLHREPARRVDGRAGAVEEGLAHAEATYLVVMDNDLTHSPALVPVLLEHLRGEADVVIPGFRAEQDLEALPSFFGVTREALAAPTLNVVELPF